jgi:uncharacterized membrane protein
VAVGFTKEVAMTDTKSAALMLAAAVLLAAAALIFTYSFSGSPPSTLVALELPQLYPPVMK